MTWVSNFVQANVGAHRCSNDVCIAVCRNLRCRELQWADTGYTRPSSLPALLSSHPPQALEALSQGRIQAPPAMSCCCNCCGARAAAEERIWCITTAAEASPHCNRTRSARPSHPPSHPRTSCGDITIATSSEEGTQHPSQRVVAAGSSTRASHGCCCCCIATIRPFRTSRRSCGRGEVPKGCTHTCPVGSQRLSAEHCPTL